ncbi:hypothetical protein BRD09_00495 [Halobacteriales archaeon SW_10_68_16]|nr:MAG: hypothetical protein BRD09_00495 [Halobacteriales archaeon SW_10_68_16]
MHERSVVSCVLRHEGAVLLCRRSDDVGSYPGRWGVVAGGAEGDPDRAAREEIAEETGLDAGSVSLVRRDDPFAVTDADLKTRWRVHPYLWGWRQSPRTPNTGRRTSRCAPWRCSATRRPSAHTPPAPTTTTPGPPSSCGPTTAGRNWPTSPSPSGRRAPRCRRWATASTAPWPPRATPGRPPRSNTPPPRASPRPQAPTNARPSTQRAASPVPAS